MKENDFEIVEGFNTCRVFVYVISRFIAKLITWTFIFGEMMT